MQLSAKMIGWRMYGVNAHAWYPVHSPTLYKIILTRYNIFKKKWEWDMSDTKKYCVIITTCPNIQEADDIATKLLEQKLAACVQITPITSYYKWKGSINKDGEHLLAIKTKTEFYPRIEEFIKEHHSYEVPEIIRTPIEKGLPSYLRWIDEVTQL